MRKLGAGVDTIAQIQTRRYPNVVNIFPGKKEKYAIMKYHV